MNHLPEDNPAKWVEGIKLTARMAGEAIMEIYEREDRGIEAKADESPLTLADTRSNTVICQYLEDKFPHIPIISEENKSIPYNTRQGYTRCWLVDPLDGTKEFIKRNGEFTVNIALLEDGKPILGVVYVPVQDIMYWAVSGHGAYKAGPNGHPTQMQCPEFSMDDTGLRVVCSRSHLNEETQAFIDGLTNPEAVSRGSSLKFMLLAEGQAELYPRLAPTMEWDTAAAHCVLEEAGGEVINRDTGKPLTYNKENLLNPFFIARAKLRV